MFNKSDIKRDECQLYGKQARLGYDWWWHSFTGVNESTGERKPFFIEFFLCNKALGQDEPVFGQLKENKEKGIRPSYLMVKAGAWGEDATQLHRFFGYKKAKIHEKAPFSVEADDCYLDEKHTHGSISITEEESDAHPEWMCDYGTIRWDLKIDKQVAFNVGFGAGKLFRSAQLFEMFWHAEGMKTFFEGYIEIDGERYKVEPSTCNGYADKNWGKDFTSPWIWLSSNNIVSKKTGQKLSNTVFDIGGGRPKVGPIALKGKLLSAIYYEGKCYEFNFSKFWTFCRTKFDCKETEEEILWHIEQKAIGRKMVADFKCQKKDMLLVNYEAPNGKKLHNRLWNGGNGEGTIKLYSHGKLIDELLVSEAGCEYGVYCDPAPTPKKRKKKPWIKKEPGKPVPHINPKA